MSAVMQPLILVDVDGVLNPAFSAKVRRRLAYHEGWLQRRVDAGGLTFRVFLNPEHGAWLRQLAADTGAELAWGTTWEEYANLCIGPLIGLPRLPVAPMPDWRTFTGPKIHKAHGFVPWTAGRPFVWFDDEPDAAEVTASLAGDQPHLVVQVDEHVGLTDDDIELARKFLTEVQATAEIDADPVEAERLRRALREVSEGKVTRWEYDGPAENEAEKI